MVDSYENLYSAIQGKSVTNGWDVIVTCSSEALNAAFEQDSNDSEAIVERVFTIQNLFIGWQIDFRLRLGCPRVRFTDEFSASTESHFVLEIPLEGEYLLWDTGEDEIGRPSEALVNAHFIPKNIYTLNVVCPLAETFGALVPSESQSALEASSSLDSLDFTPRPRKSQDWISTVTFRRSFGTRPVVFSHVTDNEALSKDPFDYDIRFKLEAWLASPEKLSSVKIHQYLDAPNTVWRPSVFTFKQTAASPAAISMYLATSSPKESRRPAEWTILNAAGMATSPLPDTFTCSLILAHDSLMRHAIESLTAEVDHSPPPIIHKLSASDKNDNLYESKCIYASNANAQGFPFEFYKDDLRWIVQGTGIRRASRELFSADRAPYCLQWSHTEAVPAFRQQYVYKGTKSVRLQVDNRVPNYVSIDGAKNLVFKDILHKGDDIKFYGSRDLGLTLDVDNCPSFRFGFAAIPLKPFLDVISPSLSAHFEPELPAQGSTPYDLVLLSSKKCEVMPRKPRLIPESPSLQSSHPPDNVSTEDLRNLLFHNDVFISRFLTGFVSSAAGGLAILAKNNSLDILSHEARQVMKAAIQTGSTFVAETCVGMYEVEEPPDMRGTKLLIDTLSKAPIVISGSSAPSRAMRSEDLNFHLEWTTEDSNMQFSARFYFPEAKAELSCPIYMTGIVATGGKQLPFSAFQTQIIDQASVDLLSLSPAVQEQWSEVKVLITSFRLWGFLIWLIMNGEEVTKDDVVDITLSGGLQVALLAFTYATGKAGSQ